MPSSRLGTPVLTVDTEKIHKVDTANAQSLHGMWMGKLSTAVQLPDMMETNICGKQYSQNVPIIWTKVVD